MAESKEQKTIGAKLLELMWQHSRPLAKYSLHEQAEEIEKRLSLLAEHCQRAGAVMTKAHMRLILGIDDNTLGRWAGAVTRAGSVEHTEEAKKQIAARGDTIKKWLTFAEASGSELVSTNPKAAGPIFLMKAVYQYREFDDKQPVNVNIGIEAFLTDTKKGRPICAEEEGATPDILPIEQA